MQNSPQMEYQNKWDLGGGSSVNYQLPLSQQMSGTGRVSENLDFPSPGYEEPNPEEPKRTSGTRPNTRAFAEKWLTRLTKAKDTHRDWNKEAGFNYGLYFNKSKAWAKAITIKGYANPLVVFTNPVALNVDTDRDRMLPKNPSFKVWPKVKYTYFKNPQDPEGEPGRRDNVLASRMYQEVANMLALELDLRKTIKRAITDSLVTNLGAVKIAWDEVGQISHGSAHVEGEDQKILGGGNIISSPNHELARPHFPWAVHVPWSRIILDPTAGTIEQVNWIAEKIIIPKAGMSDSLPKNTGNSGDKLSRMANVNHGAESEDEEYPLRDSEDQTPDIEMVEYYEVHYREASEEDESGFCYYTFNLYSGDGGAVRGHKKYDRDIGGFCYEFLQFKEIVGDLLGYSQIRLYSSPAAHANLAKQLQLDYAIRALPFLLLDSGLDKKVVLGIVNGTVAKAVKSNSQAKDKIVPISLPPLGQDLAGSIGVAQGSSDQMSGRSLNDRLQGGVDTATEAKVIDRNSAELALATVDVLRIFAARVIKKCVKIFGSLLTPEQTYQVPNGKGGFLTFEQQNLICDIAIELDWQSTVRKDDAVERKLNMDLLTILVQAKASGMVPDINLEPVLKKIVVSSGFDDPNEIFSNEDQDPTDPAHEHMLILAGEQVEPSNDEDLAKNYQEHIQFMAACMGADPQLTALWQNIPGALQRLGNHIAATAGKMQLAGLSMEGGTLPGGGGGSGPGKRPAQGVPSQGDMQGAASRATNVGGGGSGRLAGV